MSSAGEAGTPIRHQAGAIANLLGRSILAGDHLPGETVPGEIALCERFGVSRGMVREAFQTLSAKGLIESRRRVGTRVLPRERWNLFDPDVLAWASVGERALRREAGRQAS